MSQLKRWTGAMLLGALLTAGSFAPVTGDRTNEAFAQDNDDNARDLRAERASIQRLLSAHHELPDKVFFERASVDARALLFDFATDPNLFPLYRYRALEALGMHYGDDVVFTLYAKVLGKSDDFGEQNRVMMFSAVFFGERAVSLLAPMTTHEDAQLRRTAYEALALVGGESAMATLKTARQNEDNALLLERLDEVVVELR